MPPQTGQSGLAGKLASDVDKSIKEAMAEPPKAGIIQMPGGVKQGVARLVKIGFYVYKPDTKQKKANGQSAAGEYFFRAVGTATEPDSVIDPLTGAKARVAGLQTSIMRNCFDTKSGTGSDAKVTTQAENIANIVNDMRLLFGDKYMAGATKYTLENLAAGAQKSITAKPLFFNFSTSVSDQGKTNPKTGKPYPPRVFENWHGVDGLEKYSPPSAVGMVSAEDLPDPPEQEQDGEDGGDLEAQAHAAAGHTEAPPDEEPQDAAESEVDLDALAARADVTPATADSKAAAEQLKSMALARGMEESEINEADNWQQIADILKGGDEAAEAPPAETWSPKKGDVVKYNRPGTSTVTKKPFKPFNCEITDISTKKGTCTLLSKVDGKTVYKDVKLELIEQVS